MRVSKHNIQYKNDHRLAIWILAGRGEQTIGLQLHTTPRVVVRQDLRLLWAY